MHPFRHALSVVGILAAAPARRRDERVRYEMMGM